MSTPNFFNLSFAVELSVLGLSETITPKFLFKGIFLKIYVMNFLHYKHLSQVRFISFFESL